MIAVLLGLIGAVITIAFWCWFCVLIYTLVWGATGGPRRERKRNERAVLLGLVEQTQQAVRTELVKARTDAILNQNRES